MGPAEAQRCKSVSILGNESICMGGGLARLGAGDISAGPCQIPQGEQCVVSPRLVPLVVPWSVSCGAVT